MCESGAGEWATLSNNTQIRSEILKAEFRMTVAAYDTHLLQKQLDFRYLRQCGLLPMVNEIGS
tara:strand:- start:1375 stop:1563 length:189 start_codon:yes stop_codon:yes gene_type:complete